MGAEAALREPDEDLAGGARRGEDSIMTAEKYFKTKGNVSLVCSKPLTKIVIVKSTYFYDLCNLDMLIAGLMFIY